MHLGDMLTRFGTLIACFAHERKHKDFKLFATACCNTQKFEETVSINIVNAQVDALQKENALRLGIYLEKPREDDGHLCGLLQTRFPGMARVWWSGEAHRNEGAIGTHDLVHLEDGRMAFVALCVKCEPIPCNTSGFFLLVWPCVDCVLNNLYSCKAKRQRQITDIVDIKTVKDSLVWVQDGDDDLILLAAPGQLLTHATRS